MSTNGNDAFVEEQIALQRQAQEQASPNAPKRKMMFLGRNPIDVTPYIGRRTPRRDDEVRMIVDARIMLKCEHCRTNAELLIKGIMGRAPHQKHPKGPCPKHPGEFVWRNRDDGHTRSMLLQKNMIRAVTMDEVELGSRFAVVDSQKYATPSGLRETVARGELGLYYMHPDGVELHLHDHEIEYMLAMAELTDPNIQSEKLNAEVRQTLGKGFAGSMSISNPSYESPLGN